MKESIGNSFIFYIVIIFVFIFIALFVGSTSYTKAFKVKNRIISVIEKHNDAPNKAVNNQGVLNSTVESEINNNLQNVGYRLIQAGDRNDCGDFFSRHYPNVNATSYTVALRNTGDYDYCVARFDTPKGSYYAVIAYMYLDIPVIGSKLSIPIYGETKIMGLLN